MLDLFDKPIKIKFKDSIKEYLINQYKSHYLDLTDLENKIKYYERTFTEKLNNNEDLNSFYICFFIHKNEHIHSLETMYEINFNCFNIC